MEITRPNQVWAMDITYIPLARGFVSRRCARLGDRRVLSWRLSITSASIPIRFISVFTCRRPILHPAPADPQNLSLLGDRQIVLTVDHRFALSNPALVSAPSKKSFSSADLGVQRLHIDRGRGGRHAPRAENPGSAALQLGLPGRDLIGVDIKVLGQLGYRPVALDGGKRTFALKAGVWFRRGRLFMVSPVHGDNRRCQAETPLIVLFKFAEPALATCWRCSVSNGPPEFLRDIDR
jgi:hypothetical protein